MNTSLADTTSIRSRDLSIDLLKAIAIIGVIIIHNCSYNYDIGSLNWTASVFWGSLVRASVPIFFMCSGALLLSPKYMFSIKKFFTKNVLRIIISMLFWAMAYKIFHLLVGHDLSLKNIFQAIKEVLLFKQEFHLYFLQMILLTYVFLPVTRQISQNFTKKQIEYLLILWFVLGIVFPTVLSFWPFTLLSGVPLEYKINKAYAAIGYGLFGYYLNEYSPCNMTKYWVLALAGFLFTFFGTYIFSISEGTFDTQFFEGMSVGVCIMAAGVFGICTSKKTIQNSKIQKLIVYLSKASFCIFLTHVFFNYIFSYLGITAHIMPTIVSIPILASLVLVCSILVYSILSRIPIVRDWLI